MAARGELAVVEEEAAPDPPDRCLAAALVQGLAVMAFCVALSDPPWVYVLVDGEISMFGVSYALHLAGNLTRAGSSPLLSQNDIILLVLMAACCYLGIMTGLIGLLIDFLETRKCRVMGLKISALLHVLAALFAAAAVGLCSYFFVLISSEMMNRKIRPLTFNSYFGLSFYIAIFTCIMSFLAAVLSFRSRRAYTRSIYIRNPRPTKEETAPFLQDHIEAQKTPFVQDQVVAQRPAPSLQDQVEARWSTLFQQGQVAAQQHAPFQQDQMVPQQPVHFLRDQVAPQRSAPFLQDQAAAQQPAPFQQDRAEAKQAVARQPAPFLHDQAEAPHPANVLWDQGVAPQHVPFLQDQVVAQRPTPFLWDQAVAQQLAPFQQDQAEAQMSGPFLLGHFLTKDTAPLLQGHVESRD